ncbi:MAG: ATP-grasp domain-containing protein [Fimbriiglobus sp.]
MTRVLVQKKAGEFASPNTFAAWRGFTDRGFETCFYEFPELRDGLVNLDPTTLVVGGSGAVRFALGKLGVKTPAIDDLPEELAEFRGRRVWHSTWGEVCKSYQDGGPAIFIKPLDDPKAFIARLITQFRDLIPLSHLPGEKKLLVSEPVEFVSEWRFYVVRGKIVGAGWYSGDPLVFPDRDVIQRAVSQWGSSAPDGYGIDFGIITTGQTILVEVNDGYSLGCLGLRPHVYSQLLEARWSQLTTGGPAGELCRYP